MMKKIYRILFILVFLLLAQSSIFSNELLAQNTPIPGFNIQVLPQENQSQLAMTLQILLLLTILTLAPAILIMVTSFTRIVVVLHFLRQALSTQQMPPNQILIGMALFMTIFIMAPIFHNVYTQALNPYLNDQMQGEQAWENAQKPLRTFMFAQTRPKDLALFINLAKLSKPQKREDVPTHVLIPAFIISELKTAFQIGFMIFIPFLIIDAVVASVLLAMGMMMLPPVMISLPFKILLFVLVDGWYLIVGSVARSFM